MTSSYLLKPLRSEAQARQRKLRRAIFNAMWRYPVMTHSARYGSERDLRSLGLAALKEWRQL